jgi:hypothetical protein
VGFTKGSLSFLTGAAMLAGCAPNYGPGSHQAWSQCSSQAIHGYFDQHALGAALLGPIYVAATDGNLDEETDQCMQRHGFHQVAAQ